jgi:3',5'-cyclic AMP phosphodiesterase CpdA
MRIAVTADLHWGHNRLGDEATRLLHQHLREEPPELLLLGGDIGTAEHFADCLAFFRELPCRKALVPGNHDLWVVEDDGRGDSLQLYQHHLPAAAAAHDFHYLDQGPLLFPKVDLAVVGSVNWYDYSWSLQRLQEEVPNWQWHLENKAFTRGRHNDGRFVRWPLDDVRFTREVVATMERHLHEALEQLGTALVLTHHPAFYGIGFPHESRPMGLDPLLWDALSGNAAMEALLRRYGERIAFIFSGHTHRATEAQLGPARGYNLGGDYHFKRMLIVDWPAGTVQTHIFGDPNKRRSPATANKRE